MLQVYIYKRRKMIHHTWEMFPCIHLDFNEIENIEIADSPPQPHCFSFLEGKLR
jgi:hypothetical protein